MDSTDILILIKAEELDNGDIIACGDAFYSNWQLSALDPYKITN